MKKKLFSEKISVLTKKHDVKKDKEIQKIEEKVILQSKSETLAAEIAEKCKINFNVKVDFNKPNVSSRPRMEKNHLSLNITNDYQKYAVVDYSYNIKGTADLLQYQIDKRKSNYSPILKDNLFEGYIDNNCLIIPISTSSPSDQLNNDDINQAKDDLKKRIKKFNVIYDLLKQECDEYDNALYQEIFGIIECKKQEIKKNIEQQNKLTN